MIGFGQQTYVPDDAFEDYLETHTAYGGVVILGDPTSMGNGIANDDSVTTANINSITSLNINNLSITDITGVEGFTALTYLNCYNNFLTSLDVGQNTALNYLHCYNNQLTSLDVSNNPILWQLWCYDNQLTNLDVSQNTALTILHCNNNQLTNLDVSQNTTLSSLDFSSNDLTSLDVSQNTALAGLYCSGNDLTILDVSQNTALYQLACSNNQLTSLDVSNNLTLTSLNFTNNQLTSLDVSQNTALQTLYCYNNQLTSLDLRNGNNSNVSNFSSMSNSSLYCIDVDNITFANLNLNGIDSWTSFSTNCAAALGCTDTLACNYNPLVTIDDGSCVYPNSSGTNISICDTTYFWNGFTYTTSGTYTYNTTNAVGCDSIITLDLTVTNSSSSADVQTACDTYTWIDGVTYTASNNTATHTVANAVGCDSIITLDLTVTNSSSSADVQTACDTYTWIDGVTYTASNNTATHTVANAVGCDSIITLDLTVIGNPISTITQNGTDLEVTIADTYSWNTSEITQTITPTANGWYWCIVIDVNGCIGDTAFYEVTNIVIAINETINTEKTLLRVTGLLGRKTKQTNQPLFYIYDDGTVEKRIVIE